MTFLHLADLHIGKTVNGFSMLDEQRRAFAQILDYIRTERPAAAVIAGDVYDRAVPGVDAVRLFDDFLTSLSGENVKVLLISGNHDSPERLSYASRLLSEKGLFLYGSFDGAAKKVPLPDEYGEVNFWLLPFIKPLSVRAAFGEVESYGEAVKKAIEASHIDWNARNVLVSHQFYIKNASDSDHRGFGSGSGADTILSDALAVGGLDAVDTGIISLFDYAALGHLHACQSAGYENVRYAGSPVKYSFSEWKRKKSVTLVEVKEKGNVTAAQLPITPLHEMREIKGRLAQLLQNESDDYVRAILTDEEEIINPMDRLRSVYPNIMALDFENARTRINASEIFASEDAAQTLSAFDLFREFFLETQGSVMSAEQEEIAKSILEISERI